MPLPTRKERLFFVDDGHNIRTEATVKVKDTGYRPTDDYYPTMRACKCMKCGAVGSLVFEGGFNLKHGDRVMDGKPIPGQCPRCGPTELVPLPVNDPHTKEVKIFHQVQRSLDLYRKYGIEPRSMLWPADRVLEWEKYARERNTHPNPTA